MIRCVLLKQLGFAGDAQAGLSLGHMLDCVHTVLTDFASSAAGAQHADTDTSVKAAILASGLSSLVIVVSPLARHPSLRALTGQQSCRQIDCTCVWFVAFCKV